MNDSLSLHNDFLEYSVMAAWRVQKSPQPC